MNDLCSNGMPMLCAKNSGIARGANSAKNGFHAQKSPFPLEILERDRHLFAVFLLQMDLGNVYMRNAASSILKPPTAIRSGNEGHGFVSFAFTK